eukprot:CAMPEP_0117823058 /NCGR_PEP_ID=MMETSP0949-20121206/4053_1 /TAXON_ID=44440 /ORGANISM="Chattonella subsalsa, Strain CCMP2191" /LENGTH=289 /DNA_ID=CAMNT_0005662563 /DNA_START=1 /DNA_END=870 /DNA_ORIENTATION=-
MDNFDFSIYDGDAREWTGNILQAFYLLLTTIMQINLLIAILADTYSRIQGDGFANWCLMYGEFVKERTISKEWPSCLNVIPPFNVLNAIILPVTKLAESQKWAGVLAYNFIALHDILVTVFVMWPSFIIADYLYFLFGQGPFQAITTAWAARKRQCSMPLRFLYVVLLPVLRPIIFAYIFMWNCIAHSWEYHTAEMNEVIPQPSRKDYQGIATPVDEEPDPRYWLDDEGIDLILKKKMCAAIEEMPDSLNDDIPEAIGELDSKVTALTEIVEGLAKQLGDKQGLAKLLG